MSKPNVSLRPLSGRGDFHANTRWAAHYGHWFQGRWVALRGGFLVVSAKTRAELGNPDNCLCIFISPETPEET
jgi:hypothetical protein